MSAIKPIVFVGLAFTLAACTAAGEDVRPPSDELFFPTALALTPDESTLLVVNANADLRFSGGSVIAVDLGAVDQVIEAWLGERVATGGCEPDQSRPDLLECDESSATTGAAAQIGNFASAIGVQELASGDLRVFVPARGDPSVTWLDMDAATGQLDCGGAGAVQVCDDAHRLVAFRDDPALFNLPNEPFGIYVDSGNEYAMVTHLSTPTVTLIDAPADGGPPVLADLIGGLFSPDPQDGAGAVNAAGRTPGAPGDLVYVTSRSEARIQMMYVTRPGGGQARLAASEFFFLTGVTPSDDSRGIAFNDSGTRAYIVNRNPAVLQLLDTSLDAAGFPRNEFVRATEVCRDPSNVALADVGRGDRAYVGCFGAGQVWVIEPETSTLEAIVDVGRGPHAVAVSRTRRRMYVANFLEDTLAVVDLTPGAATENRFVLRLGQPRQIGGQ